MLAKLAQATIRRAAINQKSVQKILVASALSVTFIRHCTLFRWVRHSFPFNYNIIAQQTALVYKLQGVFLKKVLKMW